MHCMGSSLCFWIYTIINETMDTLVIKMFKKKSTDFDAGQDKNEYYDDAGGWANNSLNSTLKCFTNNSTQIDLLDNLMCVLARRNMCSSESGSFLENMTKISPFLYPFSIEFRSLFFFIIITILELGPNPMTCHRTLLCLRRCEIRPA